MSLADDAACPADNNPFQQVPLRAYCVEGFGRRDRQDRACIAEAGEVTLRLQHVRCQISERDLVESSDSGPEQDCEVQGMYSIAQSYVLYLRF